MDDPIWFDHTHVIAKQCEFSDRHREWNRDWLAALDGRRNDRCTGIESSAVRSANGARGIHLRIEFGDSSLETTVLLRDHAVIDYDAILEVT